jgi:hypothetical protein
LDTEHDKILKKKVSFAGKDASPRSSVREIKPSSSRSLRLNSSRDKPCVTYQTGLEMKLNNVQSFIYS